MGGTEEQALGKLQEDELVPFILRAWWLRNTTEYKDSLWFVDDRLAAPVWSKYADPLCDLSSVIFDENV